MSSRAWSPPRFRKPRVRLDLVLTLELAPGVFTSGRDHWAVAQTRDLLRRVDVEGGGGDGDGARCLDVGIQEGLVTILLERRGAAEVVGYDRLLRRPRLALVQQALETGFELVGGSKLQELPGALGPRQAFDVVVFSGVLYHMFDPFGGLAAVRGLVRDGGICVVETTTAFDDNEAMHFNSAGRFTPSRSGTSPPGARLPAAIPAPEADRRRPPGLAVTQRRGLRHFWRGASAAAPAPA